MMSLLQVCGIGVVSVALWKMFGGLLEKSKIDLDGPKKDNFLTGFDNNYTPLYYMSDVDIPGNMRKMFRGGIDNCVEMAETYGGAVKLTSLFGVSPLALWHSEALTNDVALFRKPYIYLIHSHCIMFL
jgi:hypothetical protein